MSGDDGQSKREREQAEDRAREEQKRAEDLKWEKEKRKENPLLRGFSFAAGCTSQFTKINLRL